MEEGIQCWSQNLLNIYIWIVVFNLVCDHIGVLVDEFKYNWNKHNIIIQIAAEIQLPSKQNITKQHTL